MRSLNLLKYASLLYKSDVVHIHSSVGIFRLIHLLFAFAMRKKTIVTIHSWRHGSISSCFWTYLLTTFSSKTILVNRELTKHLRIAPEKQTFFPAFIPPLDTRQKLPTEIENFINNAKLQQKKIASSNAYSILEYNHQDLYGLDLCIDAFSKPDVSELSVLIFSISEPSLNPKKIEHYQKIIRERKLDKVIYLQLGAIDFYTLLTASDISIRATNTDGDALSVRESLFLKKPCIASNCTNRPEGTLLFKDRSVASLAESILNALRAPYPTPESTGSLREIERFYLNLYTGRQ